MRDPRNEDAELSVLGRSSTGWFASMRSCATWPAAQMRVLPPDPYEITGLAWSGHGRLGGVEVLTDAGNP